MTDLTIFRLYEPHELKDGRYPRAWYDLGGGPVDDGWPYFSPGVGIKDLVREEAGHRCIRCGHPYRVGQEPIWETADDRFIRDYVTLQLIDESEPEDAPPLERMAKRATHWSACDDQCTHRGPYRYRHGPGDEWFHTEEDEPWIGEAGIGDEVGLEVQAAWRILTVHHLNERKFDCRWHNLVALCQRCHLHIQKKVEMNQVWPFEHSEWFQPYAAAFYAYSYLGEELTRKQTMERLDDLLALERVA